MPCTGITKKETQCVSTIDELLTLTGLPAKRWTPTLRGWAEAALAYPDPLDALQRTRRGETLSPPPNFDWMKL